MILMNNSVKPKIQDSNSRINLLVIGFCFLLFNLFQGCYTFKDISIPPEVKTVKVNYFENKARIVNPQLSQKLTRSGRVGLWTKADAQSSFAGFRVTAMQ